MAQHCKSTVFNKIKIAYKIEALQEGDKDLRGMKTSEKVVWSVACKSGEIKGLPELGSQMEKAGHRGGGSKTGGT